MFHSKAVAIVVALAALMIPTLALADTDHRAHDDSVVVVGHDRRDHRWERHDHYRHDRHDRDFRHDHGRR